MSKQEMEELLNEYGVTYTSALADKLLEIITRERADAERDFQNYDYWNDYIAEIISKAKADAIDEFVDRFISKNQLKQMTKKECINAMYVLADELKEQKNEKG